MKWPQDLNGAMKLTILITRGYSNITTNGRTDGAVYTRSNAATARLLSLVKPAETKHKRAMRNGDTKNHIAEHIYSRNIKSTRTLGHVLGILQTAINDSL